MSNNKTCNCPFCNQTFTPADGLTAREHLARNIIAMYSDFQHRPDFDDRDICALCIRCGKERMITSVTRNSLSRHYNVYICSECGEEEAVRVWINDILPPESWWIVSELLSRR